MTQDPRGSRRFAVAASSGFFLCLLLVWFRLEKASALGLDLSFFDALTLLAPEIGSVLLLEGLLLLLAGLEKRWGGALWWTLCIGLHVLAYGSALLEQVFFLHTESRLNLNLVRYGLENFEMLEDLLLSGVDSNFAARGRFVAGIFFLGILVGFFLRLRPSKSWRWSAPVGVAALLLPATAPVVQSDLAAGTFSELLRWSGGSRKVEERARPLVVAPQEIYRRPALDEATARGGQGPPAEGDGTRSEGSESIVPAVSQAPLSFVLVILESTRFDPLPAYHPEGARLTPELAAIAEGSWVVEEMYTTVSHTSKALVSILCGMFPRLEMPIQETLENGLPLTCLPHLLGQAGYRAAFLQTAVSNFENRPGLVRNLGFPTAAFMETMERPGFDRIGYLGIDDLAMVEPIGSFLDAVGPAPFFLTLLTLTPHHPYDVAGQPPPGPGADLSRHYVEALRHQDRFVGEVYRALAERGLLETTALILVGDHGEAFGEHRRRQHDVVPYEEVVRVPGYVLLPERFGEPRRISGLRQLTDLFPTVLALADLPWRGSVPGRDLFSTPGAERIVTSCWYTDYCLAMREGESKFVYHFGIRPTEVFDLAADPGERRDLADQLPAAEVQAAEERMVAFKLSIDGFWEGQPVPGTERLWWNTSAPKPQP